MAQQTNMDKIQELQNQINTLTQNFNNLQDDYYRNNFSSSQDFSKYSRFNSRLKIPHYSSLPSTCKVGEIAENSGKLYICSVADTWTVAGTQT